MDLDLAAPELAQASSSGKFRFEKADGASPVGASRGEICEKIVTAKRQGVMSV